MLAGAILQNSGCAEQPPIVPQAAGSSGYEAQSKGGAEDQQWYGEPAVRYARTTPQAICIQLDREAVDGRRR